MSEQKKIPHSEANGPLWITDLFKGKTDKKNHSKLEIIKNGTIINDYSLDETSEQLNIGRHPNANIQLESAKMGMFHVALAKREQGYFIEDLGSEAGTLLNELRLIPDQAVQLRDGFIVELPGFHLRFTLPDYPPLSAEAESLTKIVETVFKPIEFPKPKVSPLLAHLVKNRQSLAFWSEGINTLVVSDIIDETAGCKTFRFVGETPLLFSYMPGQFVTLLLNINGRKVQRSYSMSSSPSRPHTLDITVKRVPGGLVSNWLCDELKLGSKLQIKGPSGRFSCFEYPSGKLLFIAAGSGITPVMSMLRWVADSAANVDIKMLISSKTLQDVIFRKELEMMSERHSNFQMAVAITSASQKKRNHKKARHNNFQKTATITANREGTGSWLELTGRVNPPMIESLAPDFKERHVFICGPESFMQAVDNILRDMDFPMSQLHSESFGVGRVAQGIAMKDLPDSGKYQITFSKSNLVTHADGDQTLLEIAETHGIEIDYSCRLGSCAACMVKCTGLVDIGSDCEMDQKDRNAGYIYACCTRPQGNLEIEA